MIRFNRLMFFIPKEFEYNKRWEGPLGGLYLKFEILMRQGKMSNSYQAS